MIFENKDENQWHFRLDDIVTVNSYFWRNRHQHRHNHLWITICHSQFNWHGACFIFCCCVPFRFCKLFWMMVMVMGGYWISHQTKTKRRTQTHTERGRETNWNHQIRNWFVLTCSRLRTIFSVTSGNKTYRNWFVPKLEFDSEKRGRTLITLWSVYFQESIPIKPSKTNQCKVERFWFWLDFCAVIYKLVQIELHFFCCVLMIF